MCIRDRAKSLEGEIAVLRTEKQDLETEISSYDSDISSNSSSDNEDASSSSMWDNQSQFTIPQEL